MKARLYWPRSESRSMAFARRAHSDLDFRAHLDPLDERPEHAGQERVALVPAVVAHFVAEEARGDADAKWRVERHFAIVASRCRRPLAIWFG
jgi:hypothetical protein